MPRTAEYRLIWQAESGSYELQDSRGERILSFIVEDSSWSSWLASAPSFTFRGRHTQLTIRKESRQRGEAYWYAYRRNGQKMIKKYLGRASELTFERLEEVS